MMVVSNVMMRSMAGTIRANPAVQKNRSAIDAVAPPRHLVLLVLIVLLAPGFAGCFSGGADDTKGQALHPAVADSWLQRGFDARGTFSPPGNGPEWSDVAFEVQFDGQPQRHVVVIDRQAYVLVETGVFGEPLYSDLNNGPSILVRVGIDDGSMEALAQWDSGVDSLASDGERLFAVVDRIGVVALDLEGQVLWEYLWPKRYPDDGLRPNWAGCWGGLNVAGDGVTVGCELTAFRDENPEVVDENPAGVGVTRFKGEQFSLVARLDAATGQERWNWTYDGETEAEHVLQRDLPGPSLGIDPYFRGLPVGISVSGDTTVFILWEFGAVPWRSTVFALENETGEVRWTDPSEPIMPSELFLHPETPESPVSGTLEVLLSRPLITDTFVLVKHDLALLAFNIGTGERLWSRDIGIQDIQPDLQPYADMAVRDEELFVTSAQNLFRYTMGSGEDPGWQTNLDPGSRESYEEGPLLVGDRLYLGTYAPDEKVSRLLAYDADTGRRLWRIQWPGSDLGDLAYTQGNLVFTDRLRGTLVVVGESGTSLAPAAESTGRYPGIGEVVRVDLAGSGPGVHGEATQFRADWGDGTLTPWQTDPVLEHVYQEPGEATARFFIGNDANQTASITQSFDVGGSPPRGPNVVESAFARENQDLTFGVLGVLVALSGGVVAVTHRRSRRGRLQRELEAIDHGFEMTKEDPARCEATLEERLAHCRGLLLNGRLDESQFSILETRIQSLGRDLRVGVLDERFQFLPYGMVMALKDMLADGRISAWEREHVMAALENDKVLTPGQKKKVRTQVDRWFHWDKEVGT